MKQTAGFLRLDLAQYRELAGFSQFATELDAATRRQLDRGQRLMEIMRQDVHEFLSWPQQVAIIYAATHGYLDDVPVARVRAFEQRLLEELDRGGGDFQRRMREHRMMTDEAKAALEGVLKSLNG
jgi:F-type H+-transporting ATPase subunit alpha